MEIAISVIHGDRPREAFEVLVRACVRKLLRMRLRLGISLARVCFADVKRDKVNSIAKLGVQPPEAWAHGCCHRTGYRCTCKQQWPPTDEISLTDASIIRRRKIEAGYRFARSWSAPKRYVAKENLASEVGVPIYRSRLFCLGPHVLHPRYRRRGQSWPSTARLGPFLLTKIAATYICSYATRGERLSGSLPLAELVGVSEGRPYAATGGTPTAP